ncbi:MAG: polysaccharide deacetylase family protein [Saprospiraceae bacterium]|nr:polysaccharide deacetylase family protein [Saprospiraceae bacterium]
MKNTFSLLSFLCLAFAAFTQTSLAERLGYSKDAKLLIIHSDDLAVAHSENQASFKAMKDGSVNSASVMVPCPWLKEVAEYAQANPNHDLGLHLTLTSEWQWYKWGPAAARGEVPGLVDANGYFYDNCADVAKNAKPEEVERELRAQIEKSKALGLEPTHLDSHMGCLFSTNPANLAAYLKLAKEYRIPAMINHDMVNEIIKQMPDLFKGYFDENTPVVDRVLTAGPEDYKKGMKQYYENVLRTLPSGVSVLLIHTAYENLETQGMMVNHIDWGAAWRQDDYDFFMSKACKKLLKEQNIKLVTWREIQKLMN